MNTCFVFVAFWAVCANICHGVVFDWGKKDTITENSSTVSKSTSQKDNESLIEAIVKDKIRELASKITHGLYEQRQKNRYRDQQLNSLTAQFKALKSDLKNEKMLSRKREDDVRSLQRRLENLNLDFSRTRGDVTELRALFRELAGKSLSAMLPTVKPEITVNTTPRPEVSRDYPQDCSEVFEVGRMRYPGNFYIMIEPRSATRPFKVACKVDDKSGWTVIQRRKDGSVDFYRTWDDYKQGFGNLEGEFWLGNDRIHQITSQDNYMLRIEMEDFDGKKYYAEYDDFKVDDEEHKYTLHVSGYHGNAGDSLTSLWSNHSGIPFSTHDRDNDQRIYNNCAEHFHGAWWFRSCYHSHLNGIYYQKGFHDDYWNRNGIQWNTIHQHSSLKTVNMMIKPKSVWVPKIRH